MELKNFQFENREIRIVEGADGEPRWVAKDVALALGYSWDGHRIQHVPSEWRGAVSVTTPSGVQEMAVLTEQGLYFFLGRSDKPAALPFQKWLAGDVLPSIRKTGSYSTPQAEQLSFVDQLVQISDPTRLELLGNALIKKASILRGLEEVNDQLAAYGFQWERPWNTKAVKREESIALSSFWQEEKRSDFGAQLAPWLEGRDATTTREALQFLGVQGRAWENWVGKRLRNAGFKKRRVRTNAPGPLNKSNCTYVFYR